LAVKETFIYVDPPKLPQPPKDIIDIELVEISIAKQAWVWKITMPRCSQYNQFKGLYLRAPEGEGPAEVLKEL
jgi:hypothetical protein